MPLLLNPDMFLCIIKTMIQEKDIHYLNYIIKNEDSDATVLYILREKMKLTTRKIRALKQESCGILLNGTPVTVREYVQPGQQLQAMLNDSSQKKDWRKNGNGILTETELMILYEDEDILFVNKPQGMVCHPSKGHGEDTLYHVVCAYLEKTEQNANIHLFGRLDKDTSGIVGIAKNKVMAERMNVLRQQGSLKKEYLALVDGCPFPSEGTITYPMEEDRSAGYLKMVKGTGTSAKAAVTHYKVLQTYSGQSSLLCGQHRAVTLCLLTLETGRTHQIRFHMAAIGCPLLGDPIYGDDASITGNRWIERSALHAWKVQFCHPFTGEKIKMTADLPQDMKEAIQIAIGKKSGKEKS